MSEGKHTRTEHGGAKNGGGYWGKRAEAKQVCKKLRREADNRQILAARAAEGKQEIIEEFGKSDGIS
jgi:hypothetical protein